MNRLSVVAAKRVFGAGLLLVTLAVPRVAMAQDAAAQADPLKLSGGKPTLVVWAIKADRGADFEAAWAGIRAVLAKSDKDDFKALGQSLTEIYKVDQPPFDFTTKDGPVKAVLYVFRLDKPSTTYSYNPRTILYEYLKAGQEGAVVNRADADDLFVKKFGESYLALQAIWALNKIGG